MTDTNKLIIELLYKNKGIKAITQLLNISEKQLYVRIKQIINYGYKLDPNYHYNSDIFYKIVNELYEKQQNLIKVNMDVEENEFRCLVVSDMHIGNIEADLDLLKYVYDYASKEGISVILNCGDFIEGTHTSDRKSINNIYDQINFLLNKHPYDRNIRNFVILGNHDIHSLYYDNIDLLKEIKKTRYDIVPLGYGRGILNIKDDNILLQHELSIISNPRIGENLRFSLVGHGHEMKTKIYDKLYLCVPSLSNVSPDKTKKNIPGFIDLTICFEGEKFDYLQAKHMIVFPKIYEIGQTRVRMKCLNFGSFKG